MALPTKEELIALSQRAHIARIRVARENPAAFNEFVLRDEQTGSAIKNQPFHVEWHGLVSEYKRVVIFAFVESGKTQALSIGRVLWEIGRNPDLRVVVVSSTQEQARKIVSSISRYVRESTELHEVFPEMMPASPWTATSLTFRRRARSKDPTIQAVGVQGSIIGSRIDLLVLDDIECWENVRTEQERRKLIEWYNATLAGRLTQNAQVIAVTTAWRPDDLMHDLAKRPGWQVRRYPVLTEEGKSLWPERWSMERIQAFRVDPGPLEAARQLFCQAQTEELQRCKELWLAQCENERVPPVFRLKDVPEGCFTVTGVDVASKKKRASARTVIFTLLQHPNGSRQVLWIEAGTFSAPEIRDIVIDTQARFQSTVFVEDVGVQSWMLELCEEKAPGLPVLPFTTGMNKWNPINGVESIFAELASRKWIIPTSGGKTQGIVDWESACVSYHPSQHTPDELMACWFAKEGARTITASLAVNLDGSTEVHVYGERRIEAAALEPGEKTPEQLAEDAEARAWLDAFG